MKRKKLYAVIAMLLVFAAIMTACKKEEPAENQNTNESTQTEQSAAPETENAAEATKESKDDGELTEREKQLMENVNDVALIDFTLPDFEGKEHNLSDYTGDIIILNFWAIGCPPCVNELPDFNEVAKRDGVVLITVAQKNILGNEKEKSYEFIKQFDAVALWDEELSTMNLYPSQYYPHTYIIDRSGTVRFVLNSATYELLDELVTFVDEQFD